MKKIVFYVMTALMSTSMYAEKNDSVSANFDIALDAVQVNSTLGISDQSKTERVNYLCHRFTREMDNVQRSRERVRPNRMIVAVYRNLAHMKEVLSPEEYHNYLLYINRLLGANDLAQYFD